MVKYDLADSLDWSYNESKTWEDDLVERPIKIDFNKPCLNPSHNFPSMLYIPPGKVVTHTCPGCGKSVTCKGREIYC